jgi:hypothetical protein
MNDLVRLLEALELADTAACDYGKNTQYVYVWSKECRALIKNAIDLVMEQIETQTIVDEYVND